MQKYQFLIQNGHKYSISSDSGSKSHPSPSKSVLEKISKLAQYQAREDSALKEFRRKLQSVTNR